MGRCCSTPAANSVLPALVDDEELVAANAGIWTAAVLCQIALAPAAGLIYAAFGAGPAFSVNAISFLLSATILGRVRLPASPTAAGRSGWLSDAVAGVRLVAADRVLRALAPGSYSRRYPPERPAHCS